MIAALIVAAAVAATPTGYGTRYDDDWPPQRFTRGVVAFANFTDQGTITAQCDAGDPDPPDIYTEACSFDRGANAVLWLPNPCGFPKEDKYAKLLCHEMAHINGWPKNHPK